MCSFSIEITLAVIGVLLVALDAFATSLSRKVIPALAIGFTAVLLLLLLAGHGNAACLPEFLRSFYAVDALAYFYKVFAMVTTLGVLIIAYEADAVVAHYSSSQGVHTRIGEFYALPMIVCAGMMWMASARDLVSVFVSLELVTVSFYVLVAYTRRSGNALEAGVKYLILGALSTGILVYGIAWVYGVTGSMTFDGIALAVKNPNINQTALLFGAALLLAGLGFKVGAAPFHIWIPDVYQGAPTPVTAFLSVGSKAAGFAVLTRTVTALIGEGSVIAPQVRTALMVAAALTIAIGSLAAIGQTNLKRLLAYSSISHAGFLVLALACGGSQRLGISTGGIVAFYLATYLPMTLLGFLLLVVLRSQGVGEELKDLTGLSRRSPGMAFALTVAMASLAGLPLTAGFFGKMLVFVAAVDQGYYGAVFVAVVGAAAGFYYYFRPILAVYSSGESQSSKLVWSPLARATALALIAGIITLGVFPKAMVQFVLDPVPAASVAGK
ncbi:MAG: NADH-quinone oxidoreductase subunit [Verrucomicrobiaceae bacterium]|nr:NADH-quinone oxidoreductase subunit [Verrucomicrobiaceae bacterium]